MVSQEMTDYQEALESFFPTKEGLSFIEQLQKLSKKPCPNDRTPFLTGVSKNEKVSILTKPSCKLWSCEICSFRNANKWIARIINGVNKLDGEWSFLTVTSHEKWRGIKSLPNVRQGWKKLINRLSYEAKKEDYPFYYARIWEQHKDGTFHLHVLLNLFISKRWAKNNARECGMGYEADWHEVDNAGKVAGYMAKYTLKNAGLSRSGIAWPSGLRRIETSRNWPKLPKISGVDEYYWIVNQTREGQLNWANDLRADGYKIIDTVKK